MFGRRKEIVEVVERRPAPALAEAGSQLLLRAAALRSDDENIVVEERSVWRPDSWLMQNCWESLADAGSAPEALAIAQLASPRQPVAVQEALYRLARNSAGKPNLLRVIEHTLGEQSNILLANTFDDEISTNLDLSKPYTFDRDALPHLPHQLLYCGATAAHIGNNGLALGYLERLDQTDRAWERIVAAPEMRSVLAETTIRLSDLLTLKAGDVITTEKRIESAVTIEVEGKLKFTGSVGKFRGKKAVCVIAGTEPKPVKVQQEPPKPAATNQASPPKPAAPAQKKK